MGLRENPQETIDFPIKYGVLPVKFPLNQSIEYIYIYRYVTLWLFNITMENGP